VSEAGLCVEPRGAFALYEITDRTAGSLAFGGAVVAGNVAEFLGTADREAVFVVTVGDAVSKLAAEARLREDALSEWIIDAFGSWAAEEAADALMERIRSHVAENEALTLRYSPGYCGMAMEQQQTLFKMVQAEAVNIRLLPSMLMYPLKSISGIVGLGPRDKVSTYRAPCDRCDRAGCHMRR
jgi:cobalamin-dependent methionine synthase I